MRSTWMLTVFAVLTLGQIYAAATSSHQIPSVQVIAGKAMLESWVTLGPYENASLADALGKSAMGGSAGEEPKIVIDHMLSASEMSVRRVNSPVVDFKKLYDQPYEKTLPPTVAYLACKLTADQSQESFLMLGAHDALKVWLNGEVVFEQPAPRRIDIYSDAVKITLTAGENVLVVKTVRSGLGWSFAAQLAANIDEASDLALGGDALLASRLLTKSTFPQGEPVIFNPFGVRVDASLDYSISPFDRSWKKQQKLSGDTPTFPNSEKLPSGLYWGEVTVLNNTYSQPFAVGRSETVAEQLVTQARSLVTGEAARLNVEALARRIDFLFLPENRRGEHNRNLLHVLTELAAIIEASRAKQEPIRDVPGMHIRAFKSQLDDQTQYYRLFVPSSYRADKPLPLVVVLPTTVSSNKPFIESAFFASTSRAERFCVLAEKYGLGILWCGYRKQLEADPVEFAHVDEAIEAVRKDYAIDRDRITLAGSCSAGVLATGLVVREPGKFAAVALHNAVFSARKTTSAEMVRSCYENPGFLRWVLNTSPQDEFLAESQIPTLLVHDGAERGHGDLPISLEFAARAKQQGRSVTFEQLPQTLVQHYHAWDRMFAWLAEAKRSTAPAAATPSNAIAETFTKRFWVVPANGGTDLDRKASAKLRDQFAADWKAHMFGDCLTVSEEALPKDERARANLVLIGNSQVSSLWAEYAEKLGLRLTESKIQIRNKVWEGRGLSVQARLNDPSASNRSVVFIGGNDLARVNPTTMNLVTDGWYQYAIWDDQGKLVDAGML